jgi:hypothetical protein
MVLFGVVVTAQVALRPGQYEYTMDMKIAGAPQEAAQAVFDAAGLKGQKKLECITPDEARQAREDAVKFFTKEMAQEEDCKVSDSSLSGAKLTFTLTCVDDGEKSTVRSETTFGVDSFLSVGTMKDSEGRTSTMSISAKRVGDCK